MVRAVEKEVEAAGSLYRPWVGRPVVMGDIWEDFREKMEVLEITKNASGQPGSHREGRTHGKAQGLCAHSRWVQVESPRVRRQAGAVTGTLNAEPESRPYPKVHGDTKSLKEGELLDHLHQCSSSFRLLCG